MTSFITTATRSCRTNIHTTAFKPFTTAFPLTNFDTASRLSYHTTPALKMPEPLKASEVNSQTDPSVAKQFDNETDKKTQVEDFYNIVDKLKIGLLTTLRPSVGPVSRSMATSKRDGPDFYYLSNIHSRKFSDLEHSKQVQITFQDSSSQNWVSITGEATKVSNTSGLVKELYKTPVSAWFGDLGDGVHNGTAEDPRMAVIKVEPSYIVYWMKTVTGLGFVKEVGMAALTGQVADTGVQREFSKSDIDAMRTYTK